MRGKIYLIVFYSFISVAVSLAQTTDTIRPTAIAILSEEGVIGTGTGIRLTFIFSEPMSNLPCCTPKIKLSGANFIETALIYQSDSVYYLDYVVQPGKGKVNIRLSGADIAENKVDSVPVNRDSFSVTPFFYGDVDDNGYIQAYDAALALQYSLGKDFPGAIYNRPWDSWRYKAANVDTLGDIAANDAGLILKNSININTQFPFSLKSKTNNNADINISLENNTLIFRSSGDLYGLNLFAFKNIQVLDTPIVLIDSIISVFDIGENKYKLGLATAFPLKDNEAFLKIPLNTSFKGEVSFNLMINTENLTKSIVITSTTEVQKTMEVNVYPNPVCEFLNIIIPEGSDCSLVSIYDNEGRLYFKQKITSKTESINVSLLQKGIYILNISNTKTIYNQKFIKI
jgi:hypothetical protein